MGSGEAVYLFHRYGAAIDCRGMTRPLDAPRSTATKRFVASDSDGLGLLHKFIRYFHDYNIGCDFKDSTIFDTDSFF